MDCQPTNRSAPQPSDMYSEGKTGRSNHAPTRRDGAHGALESHRSWLGHRPLRRHDKPWVDLGSQEPVYAKSRTCRKAAHERPPVCTPRIVGTSQQRYWSEPAGGRARAGPPRSGRPASALRSEGQELFLKVRVNFDPLSESALLVVSGPLPRLRMYWLGLSEPR